MMKTGFSISVILTSSLFAAVAFASPSVDFSSQIEAAISHSDRPANQTERDAGRNPVAVLAFSQIAPGDRVAGLGAGGGYFSRLLSALVGDEGHVYTQNPPVWIKNYADMFVPGLESLAADRKNVSVITVKLDHLGFDNASLDAVFMGLIYHDTALLDVDRSKMNLEILRVLKPGGILLITDHHAKSGSGISQSQSLHRIDSDLVLSEVLAAGFVLDAQSDALRFVNDDRSKMVFDPEIRGKTDRFVYRFRKPE